MAVCSSLSVVLVPASVCGDPVGQKFTYIQLVFGSIAFKLFKGTLPQASHNKLGEFWPIPPERAGVTESFHAHAFSVLSTHFLLRKGLMMTTQIP